MKSKYNFKKVIACNVTSCVFNENGQNCNLVKITISKGRGQSHFCKSFISFENEKDYNRPIENSEGAQKRADDCEEEYFDYGELMNDIEDKIDN